VRDMPRYMIIGSARIIASNRGMSKQSVRNSERNFPQAEDLGELFMKMAADRSA
jgi:hypothetical protein